MLEEHEELHPRQKETLMAIMSYVEEKGYAPAVRDIGADIKVKSTSLVSYYLKRLEERGFIDRESNISRAIIPTQKAAHWYEQETSRDATRRRGSSLASEGTLSIPYLGYIVASEPLPVEPLAGDETVDISRALYRRDASDLFALTVQGDSMIDALINDGDMVILHHQETIENGQMAAVWLKSEEATTLKRVYFEGRQVRLQPANPTMKPIYVPAEEVVIQGKVVMVIRNLG